VLPKSEFGRRKAEGRNKANGGSGFSDAESRLDLEHFERSEESTRFEIPRSGQDDAARPS